SSITMNPDWSSSDKVLEFDLSTGVPFVNNTFTVITGPEELVAFQNSIYVSSTYYDDAWNTYAGNSKIDLFTNEVTTKDFGITFLFGRDITVLNNKVYRVYNMGICSLSDSLTMNPDDQIGNYSTIYSMASYNSLIYFGLSDYTAPDNVVIVDSNGNEIKNFQVGAIPGSFAFLESNSVIVNNNKTLSDFNLFQNYPNPFNGSTNFTYQIPESGPVTLSIYNSTGRHIINWDNSSKAAGNYSIVWDGFNKSGIPVSNGIYFALLKTTNECSRIKILYLK
ncbi:MAG: T9SS type A sorting domain-containing protein, partial [Candidatus Marinimicrobia bacterium]|nr:T9SS type A sorting domain-containing protein [Candidatus Neomarinimicrobiota bacterium]